MPEPLYRPILKRAFNITLNNRYLWVLGFLAAFLGSSGQYEILFNQLDNISQGQLGLGDNFFTALGANLQGGLAKVIAVFANEVSASAYLAIAIIIIIILFLVWLTITAQGALLKSINSAASGNLPELGASFKNAHKSFWPLLSIIASTRILALIIFALVVLPITLILYQINPTSGIFAVVIFVLGAPLFIIFAMIAKFAILYKLIDKYPWRQSLAQAMGLFANHWLVSMEIALILFVINIVAGVGLIILTLFLAIPFIILGVLFSQLAFVLGVQILTVLGIIAFILIGILFGSALSTFHNAVWALLFLKIKEKKHLSKIIRVVSGWQMKYR